jgi:hypothetical protein
MNERSERYVEALGFDEVTIVGDCSFSASLGEGIDGVIYDIRLSGKRGGLYDYFIDILLKDDGTWEYSITPK